MTVPRLTTAGRNHVSCNGLILIQAPSCAYFTRSRYWLADLCRNEGIEFVLGHTLYMKAIHSAKAKNDKEVGDQEE